MQIGVHPVSFAVPGGPAAIPDAYGRLARAAEEAGCSHVLLMDHWFQLENLGPATGPMLEGYTTLGYLAAVTERVTLGLLVTGVTYRHPGLLAKTVTTLDVLSGGRALLGIGAAWYEREHAGLGVAFPPLAERFERLEETLRIVHQMWSDDDGPFEGRHYRLAETVCSPRPLQTPRPPILVGGGGERKTLRLVARYADACNVMGTPAEVAHKLQVLDRHCEAEGRDPASIARTVMVIADLADPGAVIEQLATLAELGVGTAFLVPLADDQVAWVERLGELVVPAAAEL